MCAAPAVPTLENRARPPRGPSLTTQIFIGLLAGILIGYIWPAAGVAIKPLADMFLRMIKMIIAPLVFSTLVVGIAGSGDLKAMGRIGLKAILWFELATTVALALGLVMMNVFRPGAGVSLPMAADTQELAAMAKSQQSGWDILLHVFPTSIVDAMAKGDILQIVVFATIFGVALAAVGEKGRPLVELLDSLAQVMFRFTGYVMKFAPIGVMAAIAATVGGRGLVILVTLGKLVLVMYASLAIFVLLVVGGAQLAGVELTVGQQITMMLTLMLTSKGVAGVPRAALVILTATLSTFGLPLEGAAILLGIDQLLDMGRTAVNVMGNCIATAVVARWEGVLDDEQMLRSQARAA